MSKTHSHALRYLLKPDVDGQEAIALTFAAYRQMAEMLATNPEAKSSNLVTLHNQAYEAVRVATGLPARLVTLGLRDFARHGEAMANFGLPLDDKLLAIKGASKMTVATVAGRVLVSCDVAGYAPDPDAVFPARLVERAHGYEIHIGVTPDLMLTEEPKMTQEGILSRMGRLIAGVAHAAVDKAEGANRVAIVEQAIREMDQAADAARTDLGKAKAEEFRIKSRRGEFESERMALDDKIRLALSQSREDLARGAASRQIDLEAQVTALDKALANVAEQISEGQQALQAVLATRREAEAQLADLKRSLAQLPQSEGDAAAGVKTPGDKAAKAASAVARVTGVPAGVSSVSPELDELDRLAREHAIAERLARFKTKA